ncbi:two component transcriptional regulator, LuxR family [Novosphingobium sp. CF614]|uniref:response regulator transcription factor n=1 Tax=Novosphingobium sp. CF614 TaxID=1884364 RepID=UPI0008EFD47A|nr:response regulator [Novosphingobium sp. CF614]SFG17818.1 two component transcriptional regulator, LuxR family [Novosphingobium sp. CF614]
MNESQRVYLVDDDEAIRRSASFMLRTSGYAVTTFGTGIEFLEAVDELEPGCVLLDVRMPEISGLEVQQVLRDRGIAHPVVVMTGHGDVTVAVQAMKAGAVDFIEKPFDKAVLLEAIEDGFTRIAQAGSSMARREEAQARLRVLTPRETDVLEGLVRGHPNKTIAYDLGISPRTVEVHRANLMQKLEVASLSEALRVAFAAGLGSD